MRDLTITPLSAHSHTHPIFSCRQSFSIGKQDENTKEEGRKGRLQALTSIFFATFWQMVLSSTMRHLTCHKRSVCEGRRFSSSSSSPPLTRPHLTTLLLFARTLPVHLLTLRDALSSDCFGFSGFLSCIRPVRREPVWECVRSEEREEEHNLIDDEVEEMGRQDSLGRRLVDDAVEATLVQNFLLHHLLPLLRYTLSLPQLPPPPSLPSPCSFVPPKTSPSFPPLRTSAVKATMGMSACSSCRIFLVA